MIIMFKDIPIVEYDEEEAEIKVFQKELLPFPLRGKLHNLEWNENSQSKQYAKELYKVQVMISKWLASRVLTLSRANAKKILNAYGLPQREDEFTRASIAKACRAVSVLDSYWLRYNNEDKITWENVNVRNRHLNEVMINIALRGTSLTLQKKDLLTPEFSTHGSYAKSWVRENNTLYLYKAGDKSSYEADVEVSVSNILDSFNVNHLSYEPASYMGLKCCKCKCMSNEDYSIVHAMDIEAYCNINDMSFNKLIFNEYSKEYYKMAQVDYLISNSDRHGENWGFYMDNSTGKLVGLYPLYDHNNAFDCAFMDNPKKSYIAWSGKTLYEAAHYAYNRVPLSLIRPLKKSVFIKRKHLESFKQRITDLGIPFKETKDSFVPKL